MDPHNTDLATLRQCHKISSSCPARTVRMQDPPGDSTDMNATTRQVWSDLTMEEHQQSFNALHGLLILFAIDKELPMELS